MNVHDLVRKLEQERAAAARDEQRRNRQIGPAPTYRQIGSRKAATEHEARSFVGDTYDGLAEDAADIPVVEAELVEPEQDTDHYADPYGYTPPPPPPRDRYAYSAAAPPPPPPREPTPPPSWGPEPLDTPTAPPKWKAALVPALCTVAGMVIAGVAVWAIVGSGSDSSETASGSNSAIDAPSAMVSGDRFTWYGDMATTWALGFPGREVGITGTTYDLFSSSATQQITAQMAIEQIESAVASGSAPSVVVFAFGTVDEVSDADIERLISTTADQGIGLVLVGPGAGVPEVLPWPDTADRYAAAAADRDLVRFVDWQGYVNSDPSAVRMPGVDGADEQDSIIFTDHGSAAWFDLVNTELDALFN